MESWQVRQKHHDDVQSIGAADGLHITKDKRFIYKYEGSKVQAALKRLGHSSLGYDNCSCRHPVQM